MELNRDLSVRLANMRLPLCLGVLALHSNVGGMLPCQQSEMTVFFVTLFSQTLTKMCVPAFFLISGLLMAKGYPFLSVTGYCGMLKKKWAALVIPLFAWNLIALFIHVLVKVCVPGLVTSTDTVTGVTDFMRRMCWDCEDIPMWFVRNLILLTFAYPAIWLAVRKFKWVSVVLFLLGDYYLQLAGLFWYGAGVALGLLSVKSRLDNVARYQTVLPILCYIALCVVEDLKFGWWPHEGIFGYLQRAIGIGGLFFAISVRPGWLTRINSGMVFFMYAVHGIIIPYEHKGLLMAVGSVITNEFLFFVLNFVLLTVLSAGSWWLAQRCAPQITRVLTGARRSVVYT